MPSKITLAIPHQPDRVLLGGGPVQQRVGDDPRASRETVASTSSAEDVVTLLNGAGDWGVARIPVEPRADDGADYVYVNRAYVVMVTED
jgi:hypothetical protein